MSRALVLRKFLRTNADILGSTRSRRLLSSLPNHSVVAMPALSPTMAAGTIGQWLMKEGDKVNPGDAMAEIETDKASMAFEAQDEFYIAKIIVPSGVEVPVGEPIMVTVEEEASVADFINFDVSQVTSVPAETAAAAPTTSTPVASTAGEEVHSGRNPSIRFLGKRSLLAASSAAPAAVPTTSTTATAPALAPAPPATSAPALPGFNPAPLFVHGDAINEKYTDIPNSNMRKVIAKRLTESKTTVPHYYVTTECEIDNLMSFRKTLKNDMSIAVSVNDIVIKSAALALRDCPAANAKWDQRVGGSAGSESIDISVAVATPVGLITPIVTDADKLGVSQINSVVKDLATRAKDGKLKPEEYQGGSFTISNLGMFGMSEFTAVINPPQACILAVGGGIPRVVPPSKTGEKPQVKTTMRVSLSADRRVVDEATAGQYLQAFKEYIANPQSIML